MPLTLKEENGDLVVWTDPDSLPGTTGDDMAEALRQMRAAGHPSVKVVPAEFAAVLEENAALRQRLADAGLE